MLIAGCVHSPAEALCPIVEPGALAITEVRGPGKGGAEAPWIEVQNTTAEPIDLLGTRLRIRRLDGGAEVVGLVRRSVVVAPGELLVVSAADDDARPELAALGLALPWPWFPSAALQLESCAVLVDRMRHPPLPEQGSYGLAPGGGAAQRNDRAEAWCVAEATPKRESSPCR